MANTFRGKAQVVGVSGTLTIASVVLYAMKQSMKLSQDFQEDIVADEQGNDCAWRAYNEKYNGDIGMRLVDNETPGSVANAKALAAFLAPYAIITITLCDVAAWNTTWQNVSGGDIDLQNTAAGSMSLKLRRYADATQNTLAATIPA